MKATVEFEVPTWNHIYSMLLNQAKKIYANGFKPDIIVGVARGGWVPARILSDLLGNPNLANVRIEFSLSIAQFRKEPMLTQNISIDAHGKTVLLVDDVADSGKSLAIAKEHVLQQGSKEVKTATLYLKPWSTIKPDYYEKETKLWIVFPWDIKETIQKIVDAHKKNTIVRREVARLVKAGLPKHLAEKFLKEIIDEGNGEINC